MKNFAYKSELHLADAQKKYPEWYQKRVIEGRPRQTWTCKKDLYDWWIRKLSAGAEQGHRYWCIMTLATYAKKCGVPRDVLENDAYGLIPLMNTKGDEFTEDDVLHALVAYTDSYITYPIDTIVNRTGIPIEKNKRNGRKQAVHMKIMSSTRDILYPDGAWRNKAGRPKGSGTAEQTVREWQESHPDGKKADCIRETGLSKPTVYKWWAEYSSKTQIEQQNDDKGTSVAMDDEKCKNGENTKPQSHIPLNETPEQRKMRHYREWQEKMERQRLTMALHDGE